jgi:hypothetical protein
MHHSIIVVPAGRNTPAPRQRGNAMTDLNSENRELKSEELTVDELDSVSGGRINIQGIPEPIKELKIAKLQAYPAF